MAPKRLLFFRRWLGFRSHLWSKRYWLPFKIVLNISISTEDGSWKEKMTDKPRVDTKGNAPAEAESPR